MNHPRVESPHDDDITEYVVQWHERRIGDSLPAREILVEDFEVARSIYNTLVDSRFEKHVSSLKMWKRVTSCSTWECVWQ